MGILILDNRQYAYGRVIVKNTREKQPGRNGIDRWPMCLSGVYVDRTLSYLIPQKCRKQP